MAFVQNGGLWLVELPGGTPTSLVASGVSGWPHFSPSGTWLSVCTGAQLSVLRTDGTGQRAVGPCSGRWLPTGDSLLVVDEAGGARQIDPASGREQPLAEPPVAWSPNGRQQVSVRQQLLSTTDSTGAPERSISLWRTDNYGANAVELFSPGTPAGYGLIIADWVGDQILLWPMANFSSSLLADGAPLQALPSSGGIPRTLVPAMLTGDTSWAVSAQGRLVVVAGGDRQSWTNKRLALVDPATGITQPLTPPEQAAVAPAWSPDGRSLAYIAAADAGPVGGGDAARAALAQRRLWTMAADGSGARALTADAVYRDELPRWSGDGQWLVFVRLDGNNQLSLWQMRPDGTEL